MIRAFLQALRDLFSTPQLPPGYAGRHCAVLDCDTLRQPWDFDYIEVVDPYGNHRLVCTRCVPELVDGNGWAVSA